MKLDDIAEFYHRLYGATKQTTIIVTGTFDAKEELKHIAAASAKSQKRNLRLRQQRLGHLLVRQQSLG